MAKFIELKTTTGMVVFVAVDDIEYLEFNPDHEDLPEDGGLVEVCTRSGRHWKVNEGEQSKRLYAWAYAFSSLRSERK